MKPKANLNKQIKLRELSAETITKHLIELLQLPNHDFMAKAKKRFGLIRLGVSKELVEELSKGPEIDRAACLEQVRLRSLKERRELEKEYRARLG